MATRYEYLPDITEALRERRILVTQEEVASALEYLGLREPLGPGDLAELIEYLGPQHTANQRIVRTEKVLSSKKWADAVVAVRLELKLPPGGLTEGEARELHIALLDKVSGGQPIMVKIGDGEWQDVVYFWSELLSRSRRLCGLIEINACPMDDLRASYGKGTPDLLIRVRKLLSPAGVLRVAGTEFHYRPCQTDYLLAHVLWALPLHAKVMEPKPSVSYQWMRLVGGGGRFLPHIFNEKQATASEIRVLKSKMQDIKRVTRNCLLLAMVNAELWQGLTWDARWRRWNRLFPDFAFLTPGAFRKACGYAFKTKEQTWPGIKS